MNVIEALFAVAHAITVQQEATDAKISALAARLEGLEASGMQIPDDLAALIASLTAPVVLAQDPNA